MTEIGPGFATVIPVAPGRDENLTAVLECLAAQEYQPKATILVCDGEEAWLDPRGAYSIPTVIVRAPKHQPGMDQPRNLGVRAIDTLRQSNSEQFGSITHAAFLDTDILVRPDWLRHYADAIVAGGQEGVWYGPYDWLHPGQREIPEDNENLDRDPRWPMFEEFSGPDRYYGDLSKGLGCFSGNLVWNINDFKDVGGFWNELHHGRCEDGELGLRATAMGIPIGLVKEARGWHLYHDRNPGWIGGTNAIDVPKINARHPWVEGEDLFVVEEDGKRFNVRCACGWEGNTALIWQHESECRKAAA